MNHYYFILGLEANATVNQIKKAFREKAKLFHPDINKADDAAEKFIEINEAYNILLGIKKKPNEFVDKEDVLKKRRQEARERARYYAKKKYEDFKNSKEYKSAQIIYNFTDIIFITIALIMIIVPIFYTIINGIDSKRPEMYITATFLTSLLGLIMLIFIVKSNMKLMYYISKFKKSKNNNNSNFASKN